MTSSDLDAFYAIKTMVSCVSRSGDSGLYNRFRGASRYLEVVTSSDLDAFYAIKTNGVERIRGASKYLEVVTSSDLDAFYVIKTMVLKESEVRRGTSRS